MNDAPDTPAQAEAAGEGQTFEYFGRTWHLPAKVHLSHQRRLMRNPSNVGIVDAFLSREELDALDALDPDVDELDKFTDVIAELMGFKAAGNS